MTRYNGGINLSKTSYTIQDKKELTNKLKYYSQTL